MNFGLDEDHRLLKDSAQTFLDAEIDLKPLLTPGATVADAGYAGTWAKLAPMGWTGLMIPEEYGGAGLSTVELAIIAEEMGRTLAPSPFLGTLLGTLALLRTGDLSVQGEILPLVAAGEARLALAAAEPGGREEGPDRTLARPDGAGWRLSGTKALVIDAGSADHLVVTAADADGQRRLFLVARTDAEVTLEPWRDITREVGTVKLADAPARLIGGAADWAWVRDRALLAVSAEAVGGMRHIQGITTQYAKDRIAFGKPIGAFQSIKHGLAEMLGDVESAAAAVLYAAWTLSVEDARAPMAAAMAKAYASEAYVNLTHRSVQIFGAIGFTWEMPNHLYFKRARCNAELFGTARQHRERVMAFARAEAA
jgi:acyl-CoA dehydrogenase